MGVVYLCYEVPEGGAVVPEVFGFQEFEREPRVGEVVNLKWAEGEGVYRARVIAIEETVDTATMARRKEIRVKSVPAEMDALVRKYRAVR